MSVDICSDMTYDFIHVEKYYTSNDDSIRHLHLV